MAGRPDYTPESGDRQLISSAMVRLDISPSLCCVDLPFAFMVTCYISAETHKGPSVSPFVYVLETTILILVSAVSCVNAQLHNGLSVTSLTFKAHI